MLLFAVVNIYTMRVCLSVAIVQMASAAKPNETFVDPDRCSDPSAEGSTSLSGTSPAPQHVSRVHAQEGVGMSAPTERP